MNRAAFVFIALAILFAHILAIHQYPDGDFAAPYDRAHVAYRIGRNLVHEGSVLWDPLGDWAESYPSLTWIAVAAVAERIYAPPTLVTQWLGILCALTSVVIVAQFSPVRLAGLIAPLLVAASGAAAAAAASGTEASAAMLLATLAFLAFERRWKRVLLTSLTLLVITRPEGVIFWATLLAFERLDPPHTDGGDARVSFLKALAVVPLIPLVILALPRFVASGAILSPFAAEVVRIDTARWRLGLDYLWSFLYASGAGLLIVMPVLLVLAGKLPPLGRRALVLFLSWSAIVGVSGGEDLPFWNALSPALPILFVAVQSAFTTWTDQRKQQAPVALLLLIVAMSASFLASRFPGDFGPIPLERPMRAWMTPPRRMLEAYERRLGRMGLTSEIRRVERLRPLGVFIRDRVAADATVATFWPGSVGYLSRKKVIDLLGRTHFLPGEEHSHTWRGVPRVDLIEALGAEADYLVLIVGILDQSESAADFLRTLLHRYDIVGGTNERLTELLSALRKYEFVAVPILAKDYGDEPSGVPFLLLRNRELGLAPRLDVQLDGDEFAVYMRHEGHQQVVDVSVSVIDDERRTWSLRPTGNWVEAAEIDARTDILAYDTGQRAILLVTGRLPEVNPNWLSVRLSNASMPPGTVLSAVGDAVNVRLK